MKHREKQLGGMLIVSIVLLLVLSLLTINSMSTARLQLKMAQNLSAALESSALVTQNK